MHDGGLESGLGALPSWALEQVEVASLLPVGLSVDCSWNGRTNHSLGVTAESSISYKQVFLLSGKFAAITYNQFPSLQNAGFLVFQG